MARTIRWGILGTGGIARAFAHALLDTPDAQLVAVGSRTLASAQAFADEFPDGFEDGSGGAACPSYEALVAMPEVDIVYVATPHTMHARNALLALGAGKPVLCEKPFAMNLREAEDVVSLILVPEDGRILPPYMAGAHIDVQLPNGMLRQYSLCRAHAGGEAYEIAILRDPEGRGGSACEPSAGR